MLANDSGWMTGDPEVIRFEKDSLHLNVETLHGPEVGFAEIAIDLPQARFRGIGKARRGPRITSALPTWS